jgi:hypothetical protein
VNGVARGVLLSFRPLVSTVRIISSRSAEWRLVARNLHYRPCKRKARAETALQTDGAFATDRGGFDHFSVGDNDQRYHAAVRKKFTRSIGSPAL